MASAVKQLVRVKGRKQDGRRNNGGKRPGAGNPNFTKELQEWRPEPQRLEVSPGSGIFQDETQEQAWQRARQVVRHYVAIGYPQKVICRLMEPAISEPTLRKHFEYELENGKFIQDAKVAGTGYFMATSGRHGDMTRFWLRARMGWRDQEAPQIINAIQFKQIEGDEW